MIENFLYLVIGFVVTYLSLELAWHFTACRIKDKKLRPCMFKEIKTVMISQKSPSRRHGKEGAKYQMMTTELQEIRNVFKGLGTLYQTYLPKIDPMLIHELLVREQEKAERAPFYMVEVFTKKGTDSQWCKDHIWNTCGSVPAIYDNGTHYATNMRLTCDTLKKLNDFDFVIEVSGDYTGSPTGTGASHERRGHTHQQENISKDPSEVSYYRVEFN